MLSCFALLLILISLETIVFGADLCFTVFFDIFEFRLPIAAKFCTTIGSVFRFVTEVKKFGRASPPAKKIIQNYSKKLFNSTLTVR